MKVHAVEDGAEQMKKLVQLPTCIYDSEQAICRQYISTMTFATTIEVEEIIDHLHDDNDPLKTCSWCAEPCSRLVGTIYSGNSG